MLLKRTLTVVTALLLCLSFSACTKKAVKPDAAQNPNLSVAETGNNGNASGSSGDINLVTSAKNLVNGVFSAFGNAGKTGKNFSVTKGQAITAMVIGGAVLLGLLVLFQNRPKKYAAPKGKYQG
jgi:hypothetical protein